MGKYRLIKTIGKGNFAKVKLARHIPTGQEVWTDDLFVKHRRGGGGGCSKYCPLTSLMCNLLLPACA